MKLKTLLKTTLTALLLVTAVTSGWGQAILTETFNYPTPAYVGGNGAAGTSSNGWTTHSVTTGQTTTVDIQDGSLSYPGLVASTGNKVYLFSNANATSRDINSGFTSSTANAMYYSALVNVVDNLQINATGDYFMAFGATAGTAVTSLGGRLGIRSTNSGANFRFCIQNISTGTPTYTDFGTDLTFGTTYLVVVKFDRSTSPTTASLWVNPSTLGGADAPGSVSNASGTATFAAFTSICLRNSATTPKAQIDEIRVGTTFADVTPAGVDATAPVATFSPAAAATNVALASPITITFDEAIRNIDDSPIADPTSLITLKETDASGAAVAFTSAIDVAKKVITITPSANLKFGQAYYVAIAPVEDASNNATATLSSTFTTVAASTDATLSNLTYNGTQVPSFLPATLDYSVQLPFGTTVIPTVVATKNYANATVNITPATDLAGNAAARTTTVLVTAEDGTTTKTYTIVFSITPAITDNTLSDLKIDGTTVSGFAPTTLSYAVVLPTGTTLVPTVTATKNDATASVVITQAVNVDGTLAERTASVVVTAQDASIKTYTVVFSVVVLGADASLSDLKVDGNTVAGFAALTTTYNVSLAAGTTVVPTVTATPNDALANVVITPAVNLTGTVAERTTTIVVTAQNTTTITTYSVIFYVNSDDATLSNLTYNGTQVPSFAPATLNYNVTLPYGTTVVPTVVATKNFATATVNVVPATDLAGNLAARTTTITVTAEDGIATKTYTIVFTVALNNDATLSNLTSGGTQVPSFLPATLSYSIELPYGTTVVPVVVATKTDANATVNITPATNLAGDLAARTTTVLVTAADGIATKTYTIVYTIAPATAPLFTATYPKSANIGPDKFDVVVNTNAAGKVYFLKMASGAVAPTSATVKSTGTAISVVAPATSYSATITGLTVSTTYDVYFVTENFDGAALMATPVKLSVTTTAGATTIHDIQYTTDASGNSPVMDQTVTTSGIVTAIKLNSTTGAQSSFYIQDGAGEWNGVLVYVMAPAVTLGDRVTVTGKLVEYNKLTEFDANSVVTINSSGNALPAAAEITTAAASSEAYESVLVKVKNANCVSGSAGIFVVNDGSGDLTVHKSLYSALALTVSTKYDITGVMTWYNTSSIFELYPRSESDVVLATGVENNDAVATKAYPNPFTGDFKINAGKIVRNVTVSNMLGQKVMENTYNEENVTVVASDLKAGIYLVNIKFEDGTSSSLRMVKK